jgi:hypothetical protein
VAKASPIITALNAGELSPTLEGRVDLAKYAHGAKRIENFIPLVQGPATRRGGTRFVAEVKDSSKRVWLVRFEFSATQAFVLEFGDLYVRFYAQHGVVLSGGAPYEIVSPYPLADLTMPDGTFALKITQSGDVLYIAHAKGTYPPKKLTRFADTNWQFSNYEPKQGPLLEQNSGATTLQASGQSGTITITASSALFASTDVGRLIRLDSQNLTVKPWETEKSYSTNTLARYDGKVYKALNDKTSGTSPPIHTRGTAFDGQDGVQWEYQHAGYGIARITAVVNSTTVTATVISDPFNGLNVLPDDVVSTTTTRWQLGAWSASTEYPRAVTFFGQRLWWAGKQRIWASVPDDYENMAGDFFNEVRADNAIWRQLQAQDVNDIVWMVGSDKLLIGTGGGEFMVSPLTTQEPLGPNNVQIVRQSVRRCRGVQPAGVGTAICYVQRTGRKLLALNYSFEADRYVSTDLAVLAERITRSGIVDLAYQGEPYSILWCVLSSGRLLGFTYDQEQDVTGWHRHPIGGDGIVESVAVIPTPDGARDELWMVVRRTINGETKRYVEYMERPWEGPDEDGSPGDEQADAFYVDSGLTYSGSPTTTLSGLDHLEGETVQILADGAVQPDKVVSGGAITLSRAASKVHVGLQYISRLVPMRLEAGATDGTSQGKIKRVHAATVRFLDTLGGKIGRYGSTLDELSLRNPATPMDQAPPISSGDTQVDFGGDYDRDALIEIRQEQPLPMTVVAIMPRLRTYEP